MKLHILSDLHLDQQNPNFDFNSLPDVSEYDIRILAGDIYNLEFSKYDGKLINGKTVYIHGNHEYYGNRYFYSSLARVHCLEIGDIVIIAATTWTDFSLYGDPIIYMQLARQGMADYYHIFSEEGKLLAPCETKKRHHETIEEFKKLLEKYKDRKVVLVTHHPLTFIGCQDRYQGSPLNPAFFSNYDDELFGNYKNIVLHVHGHIHNSVDSKVYDTRVICNPRGYITYSGIENESFDPRLIVDV